MRGFAIILAVFAIGLQARSQSMSCESHKDGDASVTVCTSDEGYKSSMRCDSSGCSSITLKETEDTIENLRKFCAAKIEPDCVKLAERVDRDVKAHKGDCNGTVPQLKWITAAECNSRAEEAKLNDAVLEPYQKRQDERFKADTLRLCDKGVFDKGYCDAFKKKQEEKSKESTPAKKNSR